MGNPIVLSLRERDYGAVFFLDRSEEENPGSKVPKDRGLYRCAGSFTEFFESLRPLEETDAEYDAEVERRMTPEVRQIRDRLLSGEASLGEQKRLMQRLAQIEKQRKRG